MTKQAPYTPLHLQPHQTSLQVPRKRATNIPLPPNPAITSPVSLETLPKPVPRDLVMSFCPKCQALLQIVHGQSADLQCRKCQYRAALKQECLLKKKIDPIRQIHREIAVLGTKESRLRTFPVVSAVCSVCQNTKSETWTMAIGSEGTSAVTFLRCTACGHTRREAE